MLWLFLGIVIGFGLGVVLTQVRAGRFDVKWYQWVLAIIAVFMLLLTIENYLGLKMEIESNAANFVLLAMGLPAVVLAALIWIIPMVAKKRKSATGGQNVSA
ncbi:MAG: hypothetical protein AB7E31_02605 [Desulfitobacterium sp.]